jgi:aspartate racemase
VQAGVTAENWKIFVSPGIVITSQFVQGGRAHDVICRLARDQRFFGKIGLLLVLCPLCLHRKGSRDQDREAKHEFCFHVADLNRCWAMTKLNPKTLGIIGGVGPESTMDYYRSIIALYRERAGDGSYPKMIINSIDLKEEIGMVERNELDELTDYLVAEIGKLAKTGADFGLIASNTPHIVFDQVRERSPIPLISIVEAACDAAKTAKLKRIAIFGTTFTMLGDFYPKVFSHRGIELVRPQLTEQAYIHDKYMNELVNGIFHDETHAGLLAIVDRMKAEERIDGIILAGTELPLILREESHSGIPFLNTTQIHVAAAVAKMLA